MLMQVLVPDGNLGVYASMQRLVEIIRTDPLNGPLPAGIPSGLSEIDFVEKLTEWVRDRMEYRPEPGEIIKTPSVLLHEIARRKRAVGDCDDYVALLGAILHRLGFPVRVVVTDQDGDDQWDHVALSVFVEREQRWLDVDPASEFAVGALSPGFLRHNLLV